MLRFATATAGLVACAALGTPGLAAAQTAGPKAPFTAILAGDINTNFGVISGQQNTAHSRGFGMETNGYLRLFFEAHADNGLTYGFYVRPLATSDSVTANGFTNERQALYFRGGFGTVEIGTGASTARRDFPFVTADWGPPSVAQDYLGPDGKLENIFVQDPNAARIFNALINLAANVTEGRTEHVVYFSPRVAGFGFGISYAPDGAVHNEESFVTSTAGTPLATETTTLGQYQSILAPELTYQGEVSGVAFATGIHYIHAQSKNVFGPGNAASQANFNVSSVHSGFRANYAGWQFALDYTYAGKSDTPKIGNLNSGVTSWGWATGLEYFLGPWVVGGYYWYARGPGLFAPTNALGTPRVAGGLWEMNNYELGVGYTLAPGIKLYGAAYYYDDFDTHVTVAQNALASGNPRHPHGQVYLLGTTFDW